MVIENDPSARIQLRSRGELAHPGSCCVCGSSDAERSYIDFQVFFDYEGTIYWCDLCTTQAAETLGLFTPAEVAEFTKQIAALIEANTQLEEDLANAKLSLSAFEHISSVVSASYSGTSIDSDEKPGSDKPVVTEPASPASSGESEVKEPVNSTGRSNTGRAKRGNVTFQ